jgi:branched-chain amino acid transport system permease protein
VSSYIVGVAGALWAFVYLGSWEPLAFDINRSLQLLFMVIIGGLGSILGSFLGAGFILMLPIFLNQVPATIGLPLHTDTVTHLEFIIFGSLNLLSSDRRAAWVRAVVVDRQGKA